MQMEKVRNASGRPRRDDRSKRDDLLVAAREILRRKPSAQLMRTELAASSHTAPALVSYHFKDEASLFHAAVEPIVNGYLDQLLTLFKSDCELLPMLRGLIGLLVRIGRDDGCLLEGYINYVEQNGIVERASFLASASAELDGFFKKCIDSQILRPVNSAFLQTALWGICKTVAQTPKLTRYLDADDLGEEHVTSVQVELILTLITDGAAHRKA